MSRIQLCHEGSHELVSVTNLLAVHARGKEQGERDECDEKECDLTVLDERVDAGTNAYVVTQP